MKKWLRFNDIFSFHPPADEHGRLSFEAINNDDIEVDDDTPNSSYLFETQQTLDHKETWQKIRFDNTIRLLISIPTYLGCVALWMGGVLKLLAPVTVVFAAFAVIQLLTTWLFMNSRHARKLEFIMSMCDLISVSCAVYLTGAANSPLYFIYFIPLLVHAFHRDWALVLYNGVGGCVLYASAILNSLSEYSSMDMTNLGARMFFMLLTLGIVYYAMSLLRRKDALDRVRLNRLRVLTLVGRRLNKISTMTELTTAVTSLIKLVNEGIGSSLGTWTRFLLTRDDPGILRAVADPANQRPDLKQELSASLCPAMKSGKPFVFEHTDRSMECPVENFNFGSHVCLPVIGTENESFGILFAGSTLPGAFQTEEMQFLHHVARSLALSIQRLQRMEELKKAVEMNSCVMAAYIGSARSVEETYQAVLEGTATVLKSDQVTLMLWDAEAGLLRTVDMYGPHTMQEMTFVSHLGEGVAGRTLEKREPFWTTDTVDDVSLKQRSVKALLCLPLMTFRGEPLGVITAVKTQDREGFSMTEIDVASTFATRAALAIENAHLHQKEKRQISALPKAA